MRSGSLEGSHDRGRGILAELGVDRAQRRVAIKDDLVGCERDHRPSAHRVVRNNGCDGPVVVGECRGDLARGQDETARRMKDDLDRAARRGLANRLEHALRVVEVNVTHERNAEQ
jgi:hypothetical protein